MEKTFFIIRLSTYNLDLISSRYGYAVQDDEGNDFNQQEQSDGNTVSALNLNKNSMLKVQGNAVEYFYS